MPTVEHALLAHIQALKNRVAGKSYQPGIHSSNLCRRQAIELRHGSLK